MSKHIEIRPLTISQANEMVGKLHRHHKPVIGHRFSVGAYINNILVGAAIVGRPVSRELDQYMIAEVTRLVTDGTPNVCSFLYSAVARIAKEMGFDKIQTYILSTEPGTSLIAAGWEYEISTSGGNWNYSWRKGRREDQPMIMKSRYGKILKTLRPIQK
jgi:hypothetical protein